MPNAAGVESLGDLFGLHESGASPRQPVPTVWITRCARRHSLRALSAKTPAVAASGDGQRLRTAAEFTYPPAKILSPQRRRRRPFTPAVAGSLTRAPRIDASATGSLSQRAALAAPSLAQGI